MTPDNYVIWSDKTFYFYLFIPIFCFLISKININIDVNRYGETNVANDQILMIGEILASLFLIFLKVFSYTGIDVQGGYQDNFNTAESLSSFHDSSVELGFRLLNVIVHFFTSNYYVFLFVVGILTVLPVIYLIFKYNNYINSSISFFIYATMFYLQGFSLLRIYLAASIVLISLENLLLHKNKRAIFWLLIAMSIHISAIILLFPYLLYWNRKANKILIAVCTLLMIAVIILEKDFIIQHFSGRYEVYATQESTSVIGISAFLMYVPLFVLWGVMWKKYNAKYSDLIFCILLSGFTYDILSYSIPIFGRLQAYFISIVFIIGYYSRMVAKHSKLLQFVLDFFFVIYGIIQLITYIKDYYNIDCLMPYVNFLGFTI